MTALLCFAFLLYNKTRTWVLLLYSQSNFRKKELDKGK